MGTTSAQRWALGLSAVASFMVVLDMLVVATALTAIQRDLGASLVDLEWTVNAYTLSFAVLLMTGAALGDRYGRRRVFAAGLALFAVASAACALAPDVGTLIAARTVQGAGAALVMPLALALLNGAFPPERRGWATGVYGSVTGVAVVLGPVVGGAITQGAAWEWIFWLNVPIGLVAAALVRTRIAESRGPAATLDLPGLLLAGGAALGVVWALVRADTTGWVSPATLLPLAGGLVLGVVFVAAGRPMLPLRLFRSRAFSAGNAVVFFANAAMTGAIFFTAQLPQVAFGAGPLVAGLSLLPWGIMPLLLGARSGVLAGRYGVRPLVLTGSLLLAAGMGALAVVVAAGGGYGAMVVPMAVGGLGITLVLPAATMAVVSLVAPPDIGRASGAFSTVRQLGGAFGVAITGAVFAATGGYGSPAAFVDGYGPAIGVAAGLAAAGAVAAVALRRPVTSRRLEAARS